MTCNRRGCLTCSSQDVYTIACIIVTIIIFMSGVIDFKTTQSRTLTKTLLADGPFIVTGFLCLLETIPCWRQAISGGFLFGYSTVIGGWALGFSFVLFGQEHSGTASDIPESSTPLNRTKPEEIYLDEFCIILTGAIGILAGVLSILKYCLHIRNPILSPKSKRVSQFFLTVSAACTILYCTTLCVFVMTKSDIKSHRWIFESMLKPLKNLGVVSMLGGTIVAWLAIISQGIENRCLSTYGLTLAFVAVLIPHVFSIVVSVLGFELWHVDPQQSSCIIFTISTSLLVLTLFLHIVTHQIFQSSTTDWDIPISNSPALRVPMNPPKQHCIDGQFLQLDVPNE